PALAAATLCFCLGLFAALPAGAAATNNRLLNGDYTSTGSSSCLYAEGGFNSALQPNTPSNSVAQTSSSEGGWSFNGAGTVRETTTTVSTTWLAFAASGFVPSASASTTISGPRKYTVNAADDVTVTVTNDKGKITAGPRARQTFVINKFVLSGHVSH